LAAHITASQVQVWLESTKATISSIDANLESQISGEVIGRLAETFGQFTPSWVDTTTTPAVVQQIIAMTYAGWYYDRQFAEVVTNEATVSYGATLRRWAQNLLNDVITGGVTLPELGAQGPISAIFYPTDVSSTWDAWRANTDCNDQSLGPAKFGMGQVFLCLQLRLVAGSDSTT
jgi:hypothetical protein